MKAVTKKLLGIYLLLFLSFGPQPVFAQDPEQIHQEEEFPAYIAEAQWATVEKLQVLLAEKNYEKAILCFSEKIREKINILREKDANSLVYFFEEWTLNEAGKIKYKEAVFAGRGYFIFDVNEQEWKINEI
jgi:hypothetical protein